MQLVMAEQGAHVGSAMPGPLFFSPMLDSCLERKIQSWQKEKVCAQTSYGGVREHGILETAHYLV